MIQALAEFHFIRAYWLFLLVPVLFLWGITRPKKSRKEDFSESIAPHLAEALRVGAAETRGVYPADIAMIASAFIVLAAAGPTWSRMENPLIANTAPLVITLKVTESMENSDLTPSRLERAKFKITDLINARAGAQTALVAYAGSPHRVAPLTEDANILRPLLEGLEPAVMPKDGDSAVEALAMGEDILKGNTTPGAILFVLDDIEPSQLQNMKPTETQLLFLTMLPEGDAIVQLDNLERAKVVHFSNDDQDIRQLQRFIKSAYSSALNDNDLVKWRDQGWILAWPAALMCLLWFRRGWVIQWVLLACFLASPSGPAQAEGWRDWFLTLDQQGQIALNNKEFAKAADLFEDPYHQGYALLKAGKYPEAITVLTQLNTPEAAFAEGLARIRNREYRPAISAFETALVRRPGWPEAQHNLEVSQAILAYVETTREQSDTGEEAGIGADDTVFDNEDGRGQDTTAQAHLDGSAPLPADQWISAIDTDMQDFLRNRFLLDNQVQEQ